MIIKLESSNRTQPITIPPAHTGIVARGTDVTHTLPPGTHNIRTHADMVYAILPDVLAVSFALPRLVRNMQDAETGDVVLVDATALVTLQIVEPATFFRRWVQPQGRVTELMLQTALAQSAEPILSAALHDEQAEDLNEFTVNTQLCETLQWRLDAKVKAWGCALDEVVDLSFVSAESLREKQSRISNLQQHLHVQAQDSGPLPTTIPPTQIRDLEREYNLPGLAALASEMNSSSSGSVVREDGADSWWTHVGQSAETYQSAQVAGQIARGRNMAELPAEPATQFLPTADQFEPVHIISIIVLLAMIVFLVGLLVVDSTRFIVAALLALLVAGGGYFAWQQRIAQQRVIEARNQANPDLLTVKELAQADVVTRRQLVQELARVQEIIKQMRMKLFRAGDEDGSLVAKRLERHCEAVGEAADGSRPVILTEQLEVTVERIEGWFSAEEALLRRVYQFSDRVQQFAISADETPTTQLNEIDQALETLAHEIHGRQRLILDK